jgi:hypothetical protein
LLDEGDRVDVGFFERQLMGIRLGQVVQIIDQMVELARWP